MKELTNNEELQTGKVLLELYSPTCIPCKKQAKILEMMENEGKLQDITVLKCDATTEIGSEICENLKLVSAPTTLYYENGKVQFMFKKLTLPNEFLEIIK